ncbi:sorting nexin-4 [Microdochium nivale]|nr:sorting nexin-4 [Microdochium nivale]
MAVVDQDNFSNISWHSDHQRQQQALGFQDDDSPPPALDVESPSAEDLQHGEQLLEEDPGMNGDVLECTVSEPRKESDGTKDAFVSYLVTTNSTFAVFQKSTFTTRRRFTDFVYLYKSLSREYPACAVPPLPDKQRMEYVRGDRFGQDFTLRRGYSLQRFLNRVALHPILRRAPILHTFLESPEWNATMKSRSARGSTASDSGSGGVFDNLTDTFINAFTKVHKHDRRFIEVREKSDKLDDDLGHVEKVIARVARRETDIEADLRDLAEQFQKLITLEPGIESTVHGFAASIEDSATGLRKLREHTDQDYLGSLRDMQAYSQALKNLMRAREQKQLDHEQLTEYLNKSTLDRDALASGYSSSGALGGAGGFIRSKLEDVRGVDHEASRRDRQRKLEIRIDELTTEAERAKKTSEMFDEEVVKEVADFERIKRAELKHQLSLLAGAHTQFYDATIENWERYVKDMEKEGLSASVYGS